MATLVAGGDFPDLLYLIPQLYPQLEEFIIQGAFADVTQYLDGDAQVGLPQPRQLPRARLDELQAERRPLRRAQPDLPQRQRPLVPPRLAGNRRPRRAGQRPRVPGDAPAVHHRRHLRQLLRAARCRLAALHQRHVPRPRPGQRDRRLRLGRQPGRHLHPHDRDARVPPGPGVRARSLGRRRLPPRFPHPDQHRGPRAAHRRLVGSGPNAFVLLPVHPRRGGQDQPGRPDQRTHPAGPRRRRRRRLQDQGLLRLLGAPGRAGRGRRPDRGAARRSPTTSPPRSAARSTSSSSSGSRASTTRSTTTAPAP